ncbi:MAG: M3 family metallopeptidase, partial [candidate division Zixibacteria bacterium]
MTVMTETFQAPRWDLESIFPGGSGSTEFATFRGETKSELKTLLESVENLPATLEKDNHSVWIRAIEQFENTLEKLKLIGSLGHCFLSADVSDAASQTIISEAYVLFAQWGKALILLQAKALEQTDEAWAELVESEKLAPIRFYLDEMRQLGKEKMSPDKEKLLLDLSVDGYHAWSKLYDKMAGDLSVEFEEEGVVKQLSMGQLALRMSDPDRDVRARAFESLRTTWRTQENIATITLNSLAGYRLAMYDNRGWKSPLHESLNKARLSQASLDAMWKAVAEQTPKLEKYIAAKKKLLGIDKFNWYDQFAPCGSSDKKLSFSDAVDFIIEQEGRFAPDMAEFAKMAIEKRWVEAEDRPGKLGGAFCTGMGPFRQTRVFMTYANTFENMLTLAHELGHSYHSWILKDRRHLASTYPMTLAETASIFAETLVTDAALQEATDTDEKIMLLDQKLQAPYTMFCDIRSRYLFETQFYEERRKGMVEKDRLNELMLEAQAEAYGTLLDETGRH